MAHALHYIGTNYIIKQNIQIRNILRVKTWRTSIRITEWSKKLKIMTMQLRNNGSLNWLKYMSQ